MNNDNSLEEHKPENMTDAEELHNQAEKQYDSKNYVEALSLYLQAYEKGYRGDENRIGTMYHHGLGTEQNYEEALNWYKKAAEQGLAQAQYNIGTMYINGQGVEQNYEEAIKWIKKAADQGYEEAKKALKKLNS